MPEYEAVFYLKMNILIDAETRHEAETFAWDTLKGGHRG
jgi:hypothetical protein